MMRPIAVMMSSSFKAVWGVTRKPRGSKASCTITRESVKPTKRIQPVKTGCHSSARMTACFFMIVVIDPQ